MNHNSYRYSIQPVIQLGMQCFTVTALHGKEVIFTGEFMSEKIAISRAYKAAIEHALARSNHSSTTHSKKEIKYV